MSNRKIRTIALEEHYSTREFVEGLGRQPWNQIRADIKQLLNKLFDLDNLRISDMDEAGVDMQVLSLGSPGVEQLEASEALAVTDQMNGFLAAAILRHPTRFAGFATLPTAAPETAADVLEHAIKEYRFKGGVINGHIRGRYLDDSFFWPILERAEALQVPLYLHPTPPPQPIIAASYTGNFSHEVSYGLSTGGFGWHIETAIHVLRIILSGAFDRYPNLQLIIGHLGEALPFMLPRLDSKLSQRVTKLNRPIGAYLRDNISYTISGFNYIPAFLDLMLQVGVDRIMFSADYPYGSMVEAHIFLDQLPISSADKEKIAHINAERLLGL